MRKGKNNPLAIVFTRNLSNYCVYFSSLIIIILFCFTYIWFYLTRVTYDTAISNKIKRNVKSATGAARYVRTDGVDGGLQL